MAAPIVWFEVLGQDADNLRGFFGELFNWQFDTNNPMNYGMVAKEADSIPGGVGSTPEGPGWTTFYVGVEDVDATIAQATRMGGKVLMPPVAMPDGRIAVIADPEGHPVGLADKKA